jgi:hypothetical protein
MRDGEGKSTAFRIAPERAPGLVGVSGRVRIQVGARIAGAIKVEDMLVELTVNERDIDTVVRFDLAEDLVRVLRGELNPFVAWLQERLAIEGDAVLAVKVLIGLSERPRGEALPRLFIAEGAGAGEREGVAECGWSPALTSKTST